MACHPESLKVNTFSDSNFLSGMERYLLITRWHAHLITIGDHMKKIQSIQSMSKPDHLVSEIGMAL